MKKISIIGSSIGAVAIVVLALPLVNGKLIQNNFSQVLYNLTHKNKNALSNKIELKLVRFKRGWFHSQAVVTLARTNPVTKTSMDITKPIQLTLNNFPLAYENGSLHAGVKLKGIATLQDNSYHATFSMIVGSNFIKSSHVLFPAKTIHFDKKTQLDLPEFNLRTNYANHKANLVLTNVGPIVLQQEKGHFSLRDLKLKVGGDGSKSMTNPVLKFGISLDKFVGSYKDADKKEVNVHLNHFGYVTNFNKAQGDKFQKDMRNYKLAKFMLMLSGKHATLEETQKLRKMGMQAGLEGVRILASPNAKLNVRDLTVKSQADDSKVNATLKQFKLYFQGLPKNAALNDYVNDFRLQVNANAPEIVFDKLDKISNVALTANRSATFKNNFKVTVGNGLFLGSKLSGVTYSSHAQLNKAGLIQAGLNLAVKMLNTPAGTFMGDADFSLENVDKNVILEMRKNDLDWLTQMLLQQKFTNPKPDNLQKRLALFTSKLGAQFHANAKTPEGNALVQVKASWPTLVNAKQRTATEVVVATKLSGQLSIPKAYVEAGIHSIVAGNKQPLDIMVATSHMSVSMGLANTVEYLKAKHYLTDNSGNYDLLYSVWFNKKLEPQITFNGKALSDLDMAYLFLNTGSLKEAKTRLLPLVKQNNATAEYYLALIALSQKDMDRANSLADQAIKGGNVKAKALKQYLISVSKPVEA